MFTPALSNMFNCKSSSSSSTSPLISPIEPSQQTHTNSNVSLYHDPISPPYTHFLANNQFHAQSTPSAHSNFNHHQFLNKSSAFSPMYLAGAVNHHHHQHHSKLLHSNSFIQNQQEQQAALAAAAAIQFNSNFAAAYNRLHPHLMPMPSQCNSFPYFAQSYSPAAGQSIGSKFTPQIEKEEFTENANNISSSSSSSSASSCLSFNSKSHANKSTPSSPNKSPISPQTSLISASDA